MNRIEPTTLQFWPSFTLQFWPSFSRIVCLFSQVFRPLLCIRRFFFFFIGTFGPDRMGLTAPSEYGIAKGSLFLLPPRRVITRRLMRTRV